LFQNTNELTLEYSLEYYKIRAIGLPISLLIAGIFGVFRGYQNTSWAMKISLVGGVLNLLLDFVLIHGYQDIIPAMGVVGAAYASLIAQIVMCVLALVFMVRKTPFGLNPTFKINPEFKTTIKLTINMLIRTIALNIAFILALRFANGYGKNELSAYSVGINIWLFSSFFIDGYSNAGNAIAGKLLGEKDMDKLEHLTKFLIKINVLVALGLSLVYLIFSKAIANLYFETSIQPLFFSFFWIIIISQPVNSIAFSLDGIFKGLGEAKTLRNVLLIGTFLIFIPLLYLLDKMNLQLIGIWIAFFAWMAWRAGSLYYLFKRYLKKEKM